MTLHYACKGIFGEAVKAILVRAEMDAAVFKTIDRTGHDWSFVRRAINPAMSDQNVAVQGVMRDLLECECPIYRERH